MSVQNKINDRELQRVRQYKQLIDEDEFTEEFTSRIDPDHPLTEWEFVEDDPWTIRFKSDEYEIEVFYAGEKTSTDLGAWQITLISVQNTRFDTLAEAGHDEVSKAIHQAADFARSSKNYS